MAEDLQMAVSQKMAEDRILTKNGGKWQQIEIAEDLQTAEDVRRWPRM